MTAMLDDEVAELRRANAELQRRLDERTAELQIRTAERDDSEAQKAAIGEVLEVINSAPGDLTAVFHAMLGKAFYLCDGVQGSLWTFDGGRPRLATARGISAEFVEVLREQWERHVPSQDHPMLRLMRGERVVQILDMATSELYRTRDQAAVAAVELGGVRTVMFVALVRDTAPLGAFIIARREVRPFTDKQIALLQNFAAQAVIAMENARLLTETREALEQQTATAEVLQVINSSPGDLGPVFDAMLEKATTLCEAAFGVLLTWDGERFHRVAFRGVPTEIIDLLREPMTPVPGSVADRLVCGERVISTADLREWEYTLRGPGVPAFLRHGARSVIHVALHKEGRLLGAITVYRREVRPFSDKQIALLQNFAAQAVIAIENARLINETREALEQQTATAEVLQVINSSPGDLAPVFETILEKAHSLCGADQGVLFTYNGDCFWPVAAHGVSEEFNELMRDGFRPSPGNPFTSVRNGEPLVHISDIRQVAAEHPDDPGLRLAVEIGLRTFLIVPLYKDDVLLGVITANRREVRPFTDKQIALLQNFAAQAVIAMENARLLTETREALEQQTATAEVLQVINSSPGELEPVFDAMLERSMRLCEAAFGFLSKNDGEELRVVALRNLPEKYAELLRQPHRLDQVAVGEVIQRGEVFQINDLADTDAYRQRRAITVASVEIGHVRSALYAPLMKHDRLLGFFVLFRQEVRPFNDKQIALVRNFAAQAVIAIENARLLTETREALEQQTATAEVLGVINSSPGDLAPVFDAILEKAHTLCDTAHGSLQLWDGEKFRGVATRGFSEAMINAVRRGYNPGPNFPSRRIVEGERVVHCVDVAEIDDPIAREGVELSGSRTMLYAALRKDDVLLGQIVSARQEVRPFSERQIALVENFAAQAVIAMENARLLTETREALEQQTATAEVLQVINSSPGDLKPVFEAILEKALELCESTFGELAILEGQRARAVAVRGATAAFSEFRNRNTAPPLPGSITARVLAGERVIHTADVKDDELYRSGDPYRCALVDLGGARTSLSVTMLKDGEVLGAIHIFRQEVRPFSDKQIALLQNFAEQAVIAMENARLITETREALEQQTATAEVLQVINSSPGDLAPVFDAMLDKAHALCGATHGIMVIREAEGFRLAAVNGVDPVFVDAMRQLGPPPMPPPAGGLTARLMQGEQIVHVADFQAEHLLGNAPLQFQRVVEIGNIRTVLAVPLRKDRAFIGMITAFRQEVRPFSDKQIALLQNFAAQAVIAMENSRLIIETREALEQQTATAEVLQVINSSPGDRAPVFEAILEKARILCGAAHGSLSLYDSDRFRVVAINTESQEVADRARQGFLLSDFPHLKPLLDGARLVHVPDLAEIGNPYGARTGLFVPLRKDDALLGLISTIRLEIRPFSDKEIGLVENFAAQAVIAMENARLLTETREALEQQTATAEVLQVINSSPGNLTPVFDAMLERAVHLCDGVNGILWTIDGRRASLAASHNMAPAIVELLRHQGEAGNHPMVQRIIAGDHLLQLDLAESDAYRQGQIVAAGKAVLAAGVRTVIWVAMVKDGAAVGAFVISRNEVRPFTEKQIALLQNFAAQAVIAMENARLLDEIRQRQAELRVTFDNMVDGVAMFDAELRLAAWNRNFQEVLQLPDEFLAQRHDFDTYIRYLTERGEFGETDSETQIQRLRERIGDHYSFERTRPDGTVIEVRNNPMPDGGIVVIYSDITERKRSEAEIRAARDAAEAAYRDLKAAQASLIQAEKMASLGQLTAGIAHEIKNPLNFVNNFAGLSVELLDELKETAAPAITALDGKKRAEIDETIEMLTGNLEKIAEHGRRADNIVKSMLEHSRGSSGERRSVDLNALIDEALNLAYHGGRAQDQSFNVMLERDYAEAMPAIELVPQDITRVCLNLFGNGFYATTKRQREGGDPNFRPTLKVSTRDLGDAVEVRIRDNGTGIPPEIKDKLFQPFFTTKPTGEGTGLGLSISYDIVTQQHGGMIEVDSRVWEFTEFTVRLPRGQRTILGEAAS